MEVIKEHYRGEVVDAIVLRHWTSHGKEWAGKVVGLDDRYGLKLDFCKIIRKDWSRSGKNGWTVVALKGAGYYKISNPERGLYGRNAIRYYYWNGESSEMVEVSEKEVYEKMKLDKDGRKEYNNAEGGRT